jgi:hypothetical protein
VNGPEWTGVGEPTGDMLELVAKGPLAPLTADHEWETFLKALEAAADDQQLIHPNTLRPIVKDDVKPCRIGAFTRRALCAGLIVADGWQVSDDVESKNRGKPMRVYRWIGGAS